MPSVLDTAGVNANLFTINTSDAGREIVVKVVKSGSGNLTNANLLDIYRAITAPVGPVTRDAVTGNVRTGPDAFTFAGFGTANGADFVSGTTTTVFFRVQGTGTLDTAAVATATGATITQEAVFAPRY